MNEDDAKAGQGRSDDRQGGKARSGQHDQGGTPAAGPHADPKLTNEDATPGTGSLPDDEGQEVDPAGG